MSNGKDRAILKIDPDVLAALEATGPNWSQRANSALREVFVTKLRSVESGGLDDFEIPAWVRPKPAGK